MATLFTGDWIVANDGDRHVLIPEGVVVVEGDSIVHVGTSYDGAPERIIGGSGQVVIPGFIDVHVHAGSRALHRLFSDSGRPELFGQPFLEVAIGRPGAVWSGGKTVDEISGMTAPERTQLEADFTTCELITAGITTFLEFGAKQPMQEALARSVARMGNRAYLAAGFESGTWSCNDKGMPKFLWDEAAGDEELAKGLEFIESVQGSADDRIRGALTPRFSDTCTPGALQRGLEIARERKMPVAIHAAYNIHEFYDIAVREGKTPIEFLTEIGLTELGPLLNLGHCNFVGDLAPLHYSGSNDLHLIGSHSCTVSHCPVNLARRARYLDSWKRYSEAGANLALGTDTYPRDMFMQMRMASYFGKVISRDLYSANAADVFDAATIGPARSLGRDDIGRLAVGAKADIAVVDMTGNQGLRLGPVRDPIRAMVECGISDDISTVMINGAVRMENRVVKGVDLARLRASADKMAQGLWAGLQDWDPLGRTADEMNPYSYPVMNA
ncbi:MAG: ethylammeline chlorohydrolase [Rhizobiaceae bacterium MnEN-MB40S]|nr:MAG: ethylammeline chlorohydrolase [Rhizobiaceae bacterium MnEN-MB40S]